jgi:hypothetical protein
MVFRPLLLAVLVIVLGISHAHAQSLKFTVGGGVLALVTTTDAYGNDDRFTTPVSDGGYGFGPRTYYVGAGIKYALPHAPFTLVADFAYSPLHGNGRFEWVEATGGIRGETEYKADLYVASVGGQLNLVKGNIRPYLGGRILWSIMPVISAKSFGSRFT